MSHALWLPVITGIFSFIACLAFKPLLARWGWVAGVNARSGHQKPVVTGLGFVILAPFFLWLGYTSHAALAALITETGDLLVFFSLTGFFGFILSLLGFLDDKYNVPVKLRFFVVCALCFSLVVSWSQLYVIPFNGFFSLGIMCLLTLAYAWHINLFNFMDGMDLISVLQTLTIALGVLAISFFAPIDDLMLALALATAGLALGFAPFNWPNARAFMGDAGSYGFGLLTGTLLLYLAGATNILVPLILSGYYWMDASTTLFYRALKRENIFKAHRQHAYQRALDKGWGKWRVLSVIALSNLGTVGLACLAVSYPLHAATLCLFWVAWIIAVLRNPFEKRV